MKSILIYNNEELFKALTQIENILPGSTVNYLNEPNVDAINCANVFIIDSYLTNNLKNELKNTAAKIICLENNGNHSIVNAINIKKPYRLQEIIFNIQNIISSATNNSITIRIENFDFNPATRILSYGTKEISLTEKEAALLLLLHYAGERTISREEILKKVWGYENGVDTHTIETHVYRIRQKIGKDNDFINSSPLGYCLRKASQ